MEASYCSGTDTRTRADGKADAAMYRRNGTPATRNRPYRERDPWSPRAANSTKVAAPMGASPAAQTK